jgi:hypothetical protein
VTEHDKAYPEQKRSVDLDDLDTEIQLRLMSLVVRWLFGPADLHVRDYRDGILPTQDPLRHSA